MALLSKAGRFSGPTSTGNFAVTGLGFQPKAVLFFSSQVAADDAYVGAIAALSVGVGISSSERWAVGSRFTQITGTGGQRHTTTKCIVLPSHTGAAVGEADFVSMDADGFTINVTSVFSSQRVSYLALGGDELDVKAGYIQTGSSTAQQTVSGVGFEPKALLCAGIGYYIAPAASNANGFQLDLGLVDEDLNKLGLASSSRNGTSAKSSQFMSDAEVMASYSADYVLGSKFDIDDFTSDGFHWHMPVPGSLTTTRPFIFYLALGGLGSKLTLDTQRTSSGTQAETGLGFTPSALIGLSGQYNTALDSGPSTGRTMGVGVGIADSALSSYALWSHSPDATPNVDSGHHSDFFRFANSSASLLARATVQSYDVDGFTLDWPTADAVARELAVLALYTPPPEDSGVSTVTIDEYGTGTIEASGTDTITISDSGTVGGGPEESGEDTVTISDSGVGGVGDAGTSSLVISESGSASLEDTAAERVRISNPAAGAVSIEASGVSTITISDRERTQRPVLDFVSGPTAPAISDETGFRTTQFTWEAEISYVEYVVMVVPDENSRYEDGVPIGSAFGSSNVAGSGAFSPGQITTTIDGRDLKAAAVNDGLTVLKVFARSSFDEWSV